MTGFSYKKGIALAVLACLALGAGLLFAISGLSGVADAVIGGQGTLYSDSDNPHNFAAGTTGVRATTETRICIFCHTPHGAYSEASLLDPPLWNHKLSNGVTYTVKTTSTQFNNATIGNLLLLTAPPDQPDGASRMCLSCHDGQISIGAIYSSNTDIAMETACLDSGGSEVAGLTDDKLTSACNAYIGTDLTSKHVVSVPMNTALVSASLAICTQQSGTQTTRLKYPWVDGYAGDAQPDDVLLRPVGAGQKYSGNPGIIREDAITAGLPASAQNKYKDGYYYGVQCSSCHDPHDSTNSDFLVKSVSALCEACHTTESCE